MLENIIFFVLVGLYIAAWGKVLWFLSERSRLVNRLVMGIMAHSREDQASIKSKVLSVAYFLYSITGFALLALWCGPGVLSLFSFTALTLPLALLGFLTQVMIISLLLGLLLPVLRRRVSARITEEVGETPWIRGISQIRNPFIVRIVPGISGFFEEVFFRGALLFALTTVVGLDPWIAMSLVTLAFLIQQLIQLTNAGQFVIIGLSCIVISFTGSWMVLSSGSIFPAALAHASYAIFYVQWSNSGA